jgi:hypothetical protein
MGFFRRPAGPLFLALLLCLSATAAAATGTIILNVHPGGGTVCLGTDCRENPVTGDGVGTVTFDARETDRYYMVNVYGVEGYKPYLKQIYLDPLDTTLVRDIVLEAVATAPAGTGSVSVLITPDGGRVCLDRMCEISRGDRSGSWSVEFTEVSANTYHTLTITNDGYETYSTQVRLLPGQASTMSITLQPLRAGSTPQPVQSAHPTPVPEPTRAAHSGLIALAAAGLCGWIVAWQRRQDR